jgi:very-short-patch-repair endonuclease
LLQNGLTLDGAPVPAPETDRARELRKTMTSSEIRVWLYLRRRKLDGWKFRRQHPIGPYVVDFYCPAARLVVELDGDSHDGSKDEYEDRRQAWLESKGYRVLRLSADYPESDPIEGVWDTIDLALSEAATAIPRSRSMRHLSVPEYE